MQLAGGLPTELLIYRIMCTLYAISRHDNAAQSLFGRTRAPVGVCARVRVRVRACVHACVRATALLWV